MMRELKIDDKFSVMLDEKNNDRPKNVLRHGQPHDVILHGATPNWIIALIYALDEARNEIETLKSPVPGNY